MTLKECVKFIEQYEKERRCRNISESLFGFECSECGVIGGNMIEIRIVTPVICLCVAIAQIVEGWL